MLSRFGGFDSFDVFDELRRQMDRAWEDTAPTTFPRVNVLDDGQNVVVQADVPGLGEKDVTLTLHENVLTLAGKKKEEVPEGYAVLRRERGAFEFTRSFKLPFKVDAEKTLAQVKDGVLTVTLAKAAEAKPRQIAIRSQA
jgi:HSP20 family protein